nr:M28 family metallopeptidase [Actinomycetota bacterium]
ASQNVVSREDRGRPGTLILAAHMDAARSGAVFSDRAMRRRAAIGRLLRRPIGPFEPFFWAIVLALACAVLRVAGVDSDPVAIVQFAATVVLIVSVPLLADIALSDIVPGANDNASGVVTALRLAERYGDSLDHFDLWVVLTGSEEAFAQGSRAFLRRHRAELDRTSTVFLAIDKVGFGSVRYARREGLLLARSYHPALLDLCDQIADEDAEDDNRYDARSIVSRSVTDAVPARAAKLPAVSLSCLGERGYAPHYHQPTDVPENIDPEALERAFGFCSELIELVDEEIGPRL